MPALNRQPFPDFRSSRAAWIRGEIRAQHNQMLAMIPSMQDSADGRHQDLWERVANRAIELRVLCAELEGLET